MKNWERQKERKRSKEKKRISKQPSLTAESHKKAGLHLPTGQRRDLVCPQCGGHYSGRARWKVELCFSRVGGFNQAHNCCCRGSAAPGFLTRATTQLLRVNAEIGKVESRKAHVRFPV